MLLLHLRLWGQPPYDRLAVIDAAVASVRGARAKGPELLAGGEGSSCCSNLLGSVWAAVKSALLVGGAGRPSKSSSDLAQLVLA